MHSFSCARVQVSIAERLGLILIYDDEVPVWLPVFLS